MIDEKDNNTLSIIPILLLLCKTTLMNVCVNYCGELKELLCSVISLKTPLLPHSHFTHTIQNNVKQQQESNGCEWNNVIQQNMMRNKGKGEWCCMFQQNEKQTTCSTKGRMKQHTHLCCSFQAKVFNQNTTNPRWRQGKEWD